MSKKDRIRRLHYRLQRQGMCELDAWLAPLHAALDEGGDVVVDAVAELLAHDVGSLLAMMHGKQPIPEILRPWLRPSSTPHLKTTFK